jgi:tRNA(fMet)-specific endonuclease VapC
VAIKYLLDTDHASILQLPGGTDYAVLVARLNVHAADGVGVSVVSFHEQALGAHDRINQARTAEELVRGYNLLFKVIDLYRRFPLVAFEESAAAAFNALKTAKVRVKTMDLRIAAVALSHNLVLVTRNVRDFGKVPGLRTEDWTK